jgi:putative tryptophan/tyrosine transport system substrate-binding protein
MGWMGPLAAWLGLVPRQNSTGPRRLMFNPDTASLLRFTCVHSRPNRGRSQLRWRKPLRNTAEIEEAIAKLGREPGGGLIVAPDPFTILHHQLFIRLAQQHRLPAVYAYRTYVAEGPLMSYGPDIYDLFRRSASYVDRILKGAKPADLPVQQPTKFELAINLKTAKALGLEVPLPLLARADEVIE